MPHFSTWHQNAISDSRSFYHIYIVHNNLFSYLNVIRITCLDYRLFKFEDMEQNNMYILILLFTCTTQQLKIPVKLYA